MKRALFNRCKCRCFNLRSAPKGMPPSFPQVSPENDLSIQPRGLILAKSCKISILRYNLGPANIFILTCSTWLNMSNRTWYSATTQAEKLLLAPELLERNAISKKEFSSFFLFLCVLLDSPSYSTNVTQASTAFGLRRPEREKFSNAVLIRFRLASGECHEFRWSLRTRARMSKRTVRESAKVKRFWV